jgi:hypothetical protein
MNPLITSLRTSEVSYLQEAFLFYEAVRTRNYYKPVGEKSKAYDHVPLPKSL